jgi:hypothetical protein
MVILRNLDAPPWATDMEYPEPGTVEYVRQIGRMTCGETRKELSVSLIQRNSGPVQVSMDGMRLRTLEADLLCRMVRSAVLLTTTDVPRESDNADAKD